MDKGSEMTEGQTRRKTEKILWIKGGFTIEMSLLMPLLLFMGMQCVFLMFFFHDKSIMEGAVYEALASTVTRGKEAEDVKEGVILERFYERIQGKCLLLSDIRGSVKKEGEKVVLEATANKFGWQVIVRRKWQVLWQEDHIRRLPDILK